MGGEGKSGFRQVAPGVLVGSNVKVLIPHPDPVFIIKKPNGKETDIIGSPKGMYVFSSPQKAEKIMEVFVLEKHLIHKYSWDELVDAYSSICDNVIVDPDGGPGFFANVPLKKGI